MPIAMKVPRDLVISFYFRENAPGSEGDEFCKKKVAGYKELVKHKWSMLVITPDIIPQLQASLPPDIQTLFKEAKNNPFTYWIEKADVARRAALFLYEGVTCDALDCRLKNYEGLEMLRKQGTFPCVGNAVGLPGGSFESDTMGVPTGSEFFKEPLGKITNRKRRVRGQGPHYTIQNNFCDVACRLQLPGKNVVLRYMGKRCSCKPPGSSAVFEVHHQCTWGSKLCPLTWKTWPTFCGKMHLPPAARVNAAPVANVKKRARTVVSKIHERNHERLAGSVLRKLAAIQDSGGWEKAEAPASP